jgi:catechol 2,3-dioxygenase-like lactoylglutathione lyase family enzyme
MQLQKFDHFGINVTDIDKSLAWYEKVFGLKVVHVWPSGTTMIGNELFKIGVFSRPQGVKIADTDKTICITHVAFLATAQGLLEIQAYLNEINVPFQALEDTGIAYSIFLSDPDGNQVEITTYHDTNKIGL